MLGYFCSHCDIIRFGQSAEMPLMHFANWNALPLLTEIKAICKRNAFLLLLLLCEDSSFSRTDIAKFTVFSAASTCGQSTMAVVALKD
ncbi:hypothetical protein FKM82_014296 [Ascaphus truei]